MLPWQFLRRWGDYDVTIDGWWFIDTTNFCYSWSSWKFVADVEMFACKYPIAQPGGYVGWGMCGGGGGDLWM